MTSILCIGDMHIKPDNIPEIDIFFKELKEHLTHNKYDGIVFLGDLLHTHEKINTMALNKAIEFFQLCSTYCILYVLIGNHDYINNSQICTTNHPFNSCKYMNNVIIIDNYNQIKIDTLKIGFLPYVPDGKAIEILNEKDSEWKSNNIIFSHITIDGCKMGAIKAENTNKWNEEYPLLISGHIHETQWVNNNVYYPGSCVKTCFGERTLPQLCNVIITDEKKVEIKNIKIENVIKKVLTIKCNDISKIVKNIKKYNENPNIKYKLVIKDDKYNIKNLLRSEEYKLVEGISNIMISIENINTSSENQTPTKKISIDNREMGDKFKDNLWKLCVTKELKDIYSEFY